jgi:hypothetical protein
MRLPYLAYYHHTSFFQQPLAFDRILGLVDLPGEFTVRCRIHLIHPFELKSFAR